MNLAVEIQDLSYQHPGAPTPALSDVSLSVEAGQSGALLGASGAGKTTLLALCDGRQKGWRGSARVLGHALSPHRAPPQDVRAETGFIFQEFALVERSDVRRNVLNGRLGRMPVFSALFGRSRPTDIAAAEQAMAEAGIADLANRRVDSLSGGQRQRVAIARCLAQEPKLILADEPVSNLDPARAEDILGLITGAARARGVTAMFSSHQPDLALRFADRVVGLKDGRIVFDRPAAQVGEAEIAALYREQDAGKSAARAPLRVVG